MSRFPLICCDNLTCSDGAELLCDLITRGDISIKVMFPIEVRHKMNGRTQPEGGADAFVHSLSVKEGKRAFWEGKRRGIQRRKRRESKRRESKRGK